MNETWKPIPDFPGYEASNIGRVRSFRKMGWKPGIVSHPRVLKPHTNRSGRTHVILRRDGNSYTGYIHRLVLAAFVGPCPEGMEACHNDSDPGNNHLDNLRYDTHTENMNDYIKYRGGKGKAERNASIRAAFEAGESLDSLAERYDIKPEYIRYHICVGAASPALQQKIREATQMRYDRESGMAYAEIGKKFGVTLSMAQAVCTGKRYPEAPGPIAPINHRK